MSWQAAAIASANATFNRDSYYVRDPAELAETAAFFARADEHVVFDAAPAAAAPAAAAAGKNVASTIPESATFNEAVKKFHEAGHSVTESISLAGKLFYERGASLNTDSVPDAKKSEPVLKKYELKVNCRIIQDQSIGAKTITPLAGVGFTVASEQPIYLVGDAKKETLTIKSRVDGNSGGGGNVCISSNAGGLVAFGGECWVNGVRITQQMLHGDGAADAKPDDRLSTVWVVCSSVKLAEVSMRGSGKIHIVGGDVLFDKELELEVGGSGSISIAKCAAISDVCARVSGAGCIDFGRSVVDKMRADVSGVGKVMSFTANKECRASV